MRVPRTIPFQFAVIPAFFCAFGFQNWTCAQEASGEGENEAPPPIKALLVTGGANHDYDLQQRIVTAGIRQRLKRVVEWKVHHQGEGRSDLRIPLFENAAWAEGYDIVVHNHCFPRVSDTEYINRILAPHREGTPAVLLHGALRSFSSTDSPWPEFAGAKGTGVLIGPVAWEWKATRDPILSGLEEWKTGTEELYQLAPVSEKITLLAEGNVPGGGSPHPVAWRHSYGPESARVFAVSVGNDPATMMQHAWLDLVTRGFLWAAGNLNDDIFKAVEPGTAVPGITLPEIPESLRYPGKNLLTGARASALSSNVADDRLPASAIDGDPVSYWEAASPGPVSFRVAWNKASRIAGLVLEWETGEPSALQIEGLTPEGDWQSLYFRSGENKRRTTVIENEQRALFTAIRISVPETGPGEVIGIREIAAYPELYEIPAAYRMSRGGTGGLRSLSSSREGRKIRLDSSWIWESSGELTKGHEPYQLIDTASGSCFVLARSDDAKKATAWVGKSREGDSSFAFHPFLTDLAPDAAAVWDGEWLYVVQNGEIAGYRDTDRDGAADERFGEGRLCFPERLYGNASMPFTLSRLTLSIDGWCYGLVSAEEEHHAFNSAGLSVIVPTSGLVRFRRDGTLFETVWASASPISQFYLSDELDLHVSLEGEEENEAWYQLNALPGRFGVHDSPVRFTKQSSEKSGSNGVLIARGNQIAFFPPSGDESATVVAEVEQPFLTSSQAGSSLFLFEGKEEWSLVHLSTGSQRRTPVDLDRISNSDLPGLLDSSDLLVRKEALFELQRRRRNFASELSKKLDDPAKPAYRGALSWFAQQPGKDAFRELVEAAQRDRSAFAFRLLGDRPEVTNHGVFGKITDVTSPRLSAAILAAMEKSGTNVSGLTELSLSLATSGEEQVVTAAKNFLIEREASDVCFAVIDAGDKQELLRVAFEVLSEIPKPTVVEGIVLRLEQTRDPAIRQHGLRALCDLYFLAGQPWQCTPLISAMLDASLSDPRVDAIALLDTMKNKQIPVGDPGTLSERAETELSLLPGVIEILVEKSEAPAGFSGWLESIAVDKSHDTILRAKAAALLLPDNDMSFRDAFSLTETLLDSGLPGADRERLLQSFAKVEPGEKEISSLLQRAGGSDETRSVISWIALIDLLEQETTSTGAIDRIRDALDSTSSGPALRGLLRGAAIKKLTGIGTYLAKAAQSDNRETVILAKEIATNLGLDPASGESITRIAPDNPDYDALALVIERQGADPEAGWRIFEREGCNTCHNIHGEGPVFGPDIVESIRQGTPREFASDVLQPSVNVTSGYGSHGFELKNGVRLLGIVEKRDDNVLSLRDTGGNRLTLPRDRILWEWSSDRALMHTHYAESMTANDLAALRAFLRKLGGVK